MSPVHTDNCRYVVAYVTPVMITMTLARIEYDMFFRQLCTALNPKVIIDYPLCLCYVAHFLSMEHIQRTTNTFDISLWQKMEDKFVNCVNMCAGNEVTLFTIAAAHCDDYYYLYVIPNLYFRLLLDSRQSHGE